MRVVRVRSVADVGVMLLEVPSRGTVAGVVTELSRRTGIPVSQLELIDCDCRRRVFPFTDMEDLCVDHTLAYMTRLSSGLLDLHRWCESITLVCGEDDDVVSIEGDRLWCGGPRQVLRSPLPITGLRLGGSSRMPGAARLAWDCMLFCSHDRETRSIPNQPEVYRLDHRPLLNSHCVSLLHAATGRPLGCSRSVTQEGLLLRFEKNPLRSGSYLLLVNVGGARSPGLAIYRPRWRLAQWASRTGGAGSCAHDTLSEFLGGVRCVADIVVAFDVSADAACVSGEDDYRFKPMSRSHDGESLPLRGSAAILFAVQIDGEDSVAGPQLPDRAPKFLPPPPDAATNPTSRGR